MSAASSTETETASSFASGILNNYIVVVPAAVIIIYDHIITFGDEVKMFSKYTSTAVMYLYSLNRAAALFNAIVAVLGSLLTWNAERSLVSLNILGNIALLLLFLVWALFSSLRVYAVLQRGRAGCIIALVVFSVSLLPFLINLYVFCHMGYVFVGGSWETSNSLTLNHMYLSVSVRASAIVGDLLVMLCTFAGVHRLGSFGSLRKGNTTPLIALLLQNGSLYFGALLIMNVSILVIYTHRQSMNIEFAPLVSSLSSIIMSRFILSLRQVYEDGACPQTTLSYALDPVFRHPEQSTLIQRSFLGNIGENVHGSLGMDVEAPDEQVSIC